MEFYQDFNKKHIEWHTEQLKYYQNLVNNPTQTELDLWEIGTELENSDLYTTTMPNDDHLLISLKHNISAETFDELFKEIEESFTSLGYELDLDYDNKYYTSGQKYAFHNADKDLDVYLYLEKMSCEYMPTGKMIKEMKIDCSFIE